MREDEIQSILETCGLPIAYRMFPEGNAPPLPFAAWYVGGETNFPADGENYFNIKELTVELYTLRKEPDMEDALEGVLGTLGIWEKTEEYLDDQGCYQIVYYLEV